MMTRRWNLGLWVVGGAIVLSSVGVAQAQPAGYAWADGPAVAAYVPNSTYSYNPSGGAISIRRMATGRYVVTFEGLGGKGRAGGHVQVTAYGPGTANCNVESWASGAADFIVNVRCFDAAGTPTDARYAVLVVPPRHAFPPRDIAPGDQTEGGVERRILPGDTLEVRYPNGRIVKHFPGGWKRIEPDGTETIAMFIETRPGLPPALPSEPEVVTWLESHGTDLVEVLRALVVDSVSVANYLATEGADASLYEKIRRRTSVIHRLLGP